APPCAGGPRLGAARGGGGAHGGGHPPPPPSSCASSRARGELRSAAQREITGSSTLSSLLRPAPWTIKLRLYPQRSSDLSRIRAGQTKKGLLLWAQSTE